MNALPEYGFGTAKIRNSGPLRQEFQHRKLFHKRAPIIESLFAYRDTVRLHMPGHRGGKGADPLLLSLLGHNAFVSDVTGVPAMDELHEPHGCIRKAQELAADLFGADQTFFVVNGTSGAIHTMVLSALNDGDYIVIPRNIHKSILSAIILAGANPLFVQPVYEEYLGFALGVEERTLIQYLESNPDARKAKAVLLVNPTYYGTSQNLTSVCQAIHERSKLLLVDEAHGPHFHFHRSMPEPALRSGADAVAHGAHKMIGALTQASMLHIQGPGIDRARTKAWFQYLTSTSASYLLLASLDGARRQMALHGRELIERAIELANLLREEVNHISGLYCFGHEITGQPGVDALDPTKVTITVKELGITGYQAETYLRDRMGIQVEMSDLYNILIIVSFGNTGEDIRALLEGLRSLRHAVETGEIPETLQAAQQSVPNLPPVPEMALNPRKAIQGKCARLPLEQSVRRVSAEVVTCYPPGIPVLYPGEVISHETVDYLQMIRKLAFGISGPEDKTLSTLRVVEDV
ncbi:MAG TPA: aminotransferase class I/II-fold pyridoxal phosphate-dependent enzyme [Firmicutes bacterium]|nr:aminotransferase class I/II-fold pyridoxal phosphate-dependent enzyme [Bacillota bacterium]